ncbi:hypothetical protein [Ensifer sp. B1-9]|uniref:hypothetical protein n=1 Tax=Ensifer sp. B1-9 TaxID=3141455 RepID=UPI003D241AD7
MTAISRRIMLGGLAATAGGVIGAAIPLPEAATLAMSPEERLNAAISAVVDILREMNPDRPEAEILRDQGGSYVFLGLKAPIKPTSVEWSGPGFYKVEGKHPNGNRWCATLRLERVDYKTVPGSYYRAESWWKGRLEYARRLKPAAIRIISKDDEYAALHRE